MSDVQPWLRQAELLVGPLPEWRANEATEKKAFLDVFSDGTQNTLRIKFNVRLVMQHIPPASTFQIYNLSPKLRAAINIPFIAVRLRVGWKNSEMKDLFSGSLTSAYSRREGADIVTTISAVMGYGMAGRTYTGLDNTGPTNDTWSFESGTKLPPIVQKIAGKMVSQGTNKSALLNQLKADEGFAPVAKWDVNGWRYGYGCTAPYGGATITKAEADILLRNRTDQADQEFHEIFGSQEMDATRKDALTNMIFNLGKGGFNKFTGMISAVKANDWDSAASHAKNSLWYQQLKSSGRSDRIVGELKNGNVGNTTINVPDIVVGKRGFSCFGKLDNIMNGLARTYGFTWWIDEAGFHAEKDADPTQHPAQLLSYKNGTLMRAEPVLNGVWQVYAGLSFRGLLDPAIRPGGYVQIESKVNPFLNAAWFVREATYTGDTAGGPWYVDGYSQLISPEGLL